MKRPGHSELLSEVDTVPKLILIIPASNAQPESIVSGLKRVKTYLRNSMSQERLNHIMLMNVHQEKAENLSLPEIAQEFVWDSEHEKRRNDFGKFV